MSTPQPQTITHLAHLAPGHPKPERRHPSRSEKAMALLALSHTPVEHRLYQAMFTEVTAERKRYGSFSIHRLMTLVQFHSYSTIRRGVAGLIAKLTLSRHPVVDASSRRANVYVVYTPEEIFARRRGAGLPPYPPELHSAQVNSVVHLAAERIVGYWNLTRREAQIALCCVEGLTNAQIGEKLYVSEQTVKSHLRSIFVKLGVKRRTELVCRLLSKNESGEDIQ